MSRHFLTAAAAAMLSLTAYGQGGYSSVDRAMELIAARNYIAAIPVMESALESIDATKEIERNALEFYLALSYSYLNGEDPESEIVNYLNNNPFSPYRSEAIFALAGIYTSKGMYEEAEELFASVDESSLTSDELDRYYFNYGYSLMMNEKMDQAKEYLLKAEGLGGEHRRQATYYIAYIDYLDERYEDAKNRFSQIADMSEFSASVPYFMLQIEFALGNYRYVADNGESLLASAKDEYRGEMCRVIGESFFHLKEYSKAANYLKRHREIAGTMGRNENYLLGYSLYMLDDYAEAADNFSAIVEGEDSLSQNAYYHLGDCYILIGNRQGALSAFSMAASFDYDAQITEDALYNFIKLQHELSGSSLVYDRSIASVNNYLKRYPNSEHREELESILIDSYMNSNNYDAAYSALKNLNRTDNKSRLALQQVAYMRGVDLYVSKDYDSAIEMFDASLSNPLSARFSALSKFWKAEVVYSKGDYDRAVELYKEYVLVAPKSEPEYMMALYSLGYCYFSRSFSEDAALWFNRYVSSATSNTALLSDSYNRLGDLRFSNREYDEAISDYSKALSYDSESSYSLYQQALAYGLKGNSSKKLDILQSISSNSSYSNRDEAMFEMGRTYIQAADYSRGSKVLEQMIKEMPTSSLMVGTLSQLGLAYQNMNDNSRALSYYKQVVENYPQSPEAKGAMLGVKSIYTELGDVDKYLAFAESVGVDTAASGESENMTYAVAEKSYASGNYSNAARQFSDFLSKFPSSSRVAVATYSLADSYKRLGDERNALDNYMLVAAMSVNDFTARSIIYAGEILLKSQEMAEAYNLLRKMGQATTDKSLTAQADYMALKAAIGLDDRAKSELVAESIISNKSADTESQQLANLTLGRYYIADRKYDSAVTALKKASTELKSIEGAEAKYLLAQALFLDKETADAETEILDFSRRGTPHRDILARAFILLGDIYLFKGDSFQAKATYQSIIDGYDGDGDGIKEEAEIKRNQIK